MTLPSLTEEEVISATKFWLEKCVIGLNLCPFASPVYVKGLIRFVVSKARSEEALLVDLRLALEGLAQASREDFETTLLIHPYVLSDFYDYNDFLNPAEEILTRLELDGVLQIASFHPNYLFAGRSQKDMSNFTNRSPFPMLHLLREDSLDEALESYPNTDEIFKRNIKTMRKLGLEGWKALN